MAGTALATATLNVRSIDQKTIKVYGSVAFNNAAGHTDYAVGGLALDITPSGLTGFAVAGKIVDVRFSSPGGFIYSYDAVAKKIKEFTAVGVEHTAAAASDFAADVPTFEATYLRESV
jgi:hypothetical protein